MDIGLLRSLNEVSSLKLSEIRRQNPDLFGALRGDAETRARAYLRAIRGKFSPRLDEYIQRADFDQLIEVEGTPAEAILRMLDARQTPPEVRAEAIERMEFFDQAGFLKSKPLLDYTVADHPLLEAERRAIAVIAAADIARLDDRLTASVLNALGSEPVLTPATFPKLVEQRVLDRRAAERLAAGSDVLALADGNSARRLRVGTIRSDRPILCR
jgi:hypothetical protein